MASLAKPRCTPEEYLEHERRADHKSEYLSGEIFAMAGASREHVLIITNILRELSSQLRGRPCETYGTDMRVKVSATGLYTYPDVTVTCGPPQFTDAQVDTLTNPTVIFEVLSPSTEAYDRGEKFSHYRALEALTDYVLISQKTPRIEQFVRREDGVWLFSALDTLGGRLALPTIGCSLSLAEVYDRVEFVS